MARNLTPRGTSTDERIKMLSQPDDNGCWIWQASLHKTGYAHIRVGRKTKWAHRVAFEAFIGPIPEGLTVDHLCFVPACVNPEHLRLLSNEENAGHQRRALATHCARGHEFTEENTLRHRKTEGDGKRACRACFNASQRRRAERLKAERGAA